MKKSSIIIALVSAIFSAVPLSLTSCASSPKANDSHESVIIDWKDKALGQVEKPAWVMQLKWGNDRPFKEAFGLEYSRVCRIGGGRSVLLKQAEELSRTDASRKIANEMQQTILAKAGESLSDEQLKTVNEAMTSASVSINGLREEESHWWLVKKWDSKAKKYYEEYECFTAYSMPKDSWDEAAKQYLLSVMAASGVERDSQEKLGAVYSTLQESAHRESEEDYSAEKARAKQTLSRLGTDIADEFERASELSALLK